MEDSKKKSDMNFDEVEDDGELSLNEFLSATVFGIVSEAFSRYLEERKSGALTTSAIDANLKLHLIKKFRNELLPARYKSPLLREKRIFSTINKIKSLGDYKRQKNITIKAVEHLFKTVPSVAWDISQDLLSDDYVSNINLMERVFANESLLGRALPIIIHKIYISEDRSMKVLFNTLERSENLSPGDLTSKIFGSNENVVRSILCILLIVVGFPLCLSIIGVNYDDDEDISELMDEFIEYEPDFFEEMVMRLNENNIFSDIKDFEVFRTRLEILDALPIELQREYIIEENHQHIDKEEILFGWLFDSASIRDEDVEERKKIISNNDKQNKMQQENIQKLREDVARLTNELKNANSERGKNVGTNNPLQSENRNLQNQINKLKEDSASYRDELLNLKKFTQIILNGDDVEKLEKEEPPIIKSSISEIQRHIAFVGGHENLHMKLRKTFPKSLYLNPDKLNFSSDAFDNIKYCLYFTEYCNHTMFYKVSAEIKKRPIKSSFCPYNNVDKVFESLNGLVKFL